MKVGNQTIKFKNSPKIFDTSSIVGPKEMQGPLANEFDMHSDDIFFGEKTFEKAESRMMNNCINNLFTKTGMTPEKIDYIFAGDLLNQCMASGLGIRDLDIPLFGVYGACSTFVESLILASSFIDSEYASKVIAATSSHFCSSERQFRMPLEHGNQKSPTAQCTVTASGCALVVPKDYKDTTGAYATYATPGKIIDLGIKDGMNMGAAMAPAALDTLVTHLQDTGRKPSYYDAIITGDLGHVGKEILIELAQTKGFNIKSNYNDCGVLIFDKATQDTHAGGSGCACCGTVFSGYLFNMLKTKKYKKILLIATGALMNSTSTQQGESIPGIAHAVSIEI